MNTCFAHSKSDAVSRKVHRCRFDEANLHTENPIVWLTIELKCWFGTHLNFSLNRTGRTSRSHRFCPNATQTCKIACAKRIQFFVWNNRKLFNVARNKIFLLVFFIIFFLFFSIKRHDDNHRQSILINRYCSRGAAIEWQPSDFACVVHSRRILLFKFDALVKYVRLRVNFSKRFLCHRRWCCFHRRFASCHEMRHSVCHSIGFGEINEIDVVSFKRCVVRPSEHCLDDEIHFWFYTRKWRLFFKMKSPKKS